MEVRHGAMRVVSMADSAVDVEAMGKRDCVRYIRERDESLLKFVPGLKPTWFELRRIPASLFTRYIMEGRSQSEQRHRAFVVGVERVRNLDCADGETRLLLEPTDKAHTPAGTLKVWGDKEVDLIPPVYVEEVGDIALTWSSLPPKARASYQLPPLSLVASTARIFPPVDEIPEDAPPSSDEDREAPPSSSGDDGDGGIDVRATVSPISE